MENALAEQDRFIGSGQQELLKALAIVLMVFDHAIFAFQPDSIYWHIPGRIVFPIFAFLIAHNLLRNNGNSRAYVTRLLVFAIISQLPSVWFFGREIYEINIFGTLLTGAGIVLLIQMVTRYPAHLKRIYTTLAVSMGVLFGWVFEYGSFGILSILAFYYAITSKWSMVSAILLVTCLFFLNADTNLVLAFSALAAVPVIFFIKGSSLKIPRIPKYYVYWFYPVHLVVLKCTTYYP